jgi:outer membrane lipoprotein-sorting protein
MNKLWLILVLALLAAAAFPSMVLSGDWGSDWEELRRTISLVKSIRTDFVQQKSLKILSRPITSRGRFFYREPGDIRWEYETPIRSVVLLHKGEAHRYMRRDGGEYDEDRGPGVEAVRFVLEEMTHWFAGDFEAGDTFVPTLMPGSPSKIILSPRKQGLQGYIQRIELTLSPRPGVLQSVEIVESTDASTLIEFHNPEINPALSDRLFERVE